MNLLTVIGEELHRFHQKLLMDFMTYLANHPVTEDHDGKTIMRMILKAHNATIGQLDTDRLLAPDQRVKVGNAADLALLGKVWPIISSSMKTILIEVTDLKDSDVQKSDMLGPLTQWFLNTTSNRHQLFVDVLREVAKQLHDNKSPKNGTETDEKHIEPETVPCPNDATWTTHDGITLCNTHCTKFFREQFKVFRQEPQKGGCRSRVQKVNSEESKQKSSENMEIVNGNTVTTIASCRCSQVYQTAKGQLLCLEHAKILYPDEELKALEYLDAGGCWVQVNVCHQEPVVTNPDYEKMKTGFVRCQAFLSIPTETRPPTLCPGQASLLYKGLLICYSCNNVLTQRVPEKLVSETINRYREVDTGLLKVQCKATEVYQLLGGTLLCKHHLVEMCLENQPLSKIEAMQGECMAQYIISQNLKPAQKLPTQCHSLMVVTNKSTEPTACRQAASAFFNDIPLCPSCFAMYTDADAKGAGQCKATDPKNGQRCSSLDTDTSFMGAVLCKEHKARYKVVPTVDSVKESKQLKSRKVTSSDKCSVAVGTTGKFHCLNKAETGYAGDPMCSQHRASVRNGRQHG